jgi:hypothetical protein
MSVSGIKVNKLFIQARKIISLILIILVLSIGCSREPGKLFELIPAEKSGIKFINEILEDEYFNIISYEYLYNGAGVGIGDFNNDGLQDIFFSGNMISNRLYLNKGDLQFIDITKTAGIEASDKWCTGVAVVDINHDGWQDIYVCASYNADPGLRQNLMFIHQGLNDEGLPSFTEMGADMHINDDGYSTNAAFFDYDNDDDLDLYVLTNMLDTDFPNKYRPKKNDGSSITNDRFYRNKGDGTFENFTVQSGIIYEGYGLGISIVDMNQDGWKDIYITNDYLTNDLLYINNQDGTFSNQISDHTKHMGHAAMGHDVGDINNDALPDIYTLDMLPEDNQRLKQMYAGSRFKNNNENEKYGYDYQYKRNMIQLNNGPDVYGNHLFSEIGLLSNAFSTDWSWSALLADFDNDGYRDLFVSNGYPRDVTDLDYATTGSRRGMRLSMEEELGNIPVRHIQNYIFKNSGKYTFMDRSDEWGMGLPSFSNGAAYADLDNDGDLDIVTTNINEPVSLYENQLYTQQEKRKETHFLKLKLISETCSSIGLGTIIYAFAGDEIIYTDHSTYHGFLSTMDPIIHIGLGANTILDSLYIISPAGKSGRWYNIQADQMISIDIDKLKEISGYPNIHLSDSSQYIVVPQNNDLSIHHKHTEDPFNDFNIQPTIPFQLSQSGPGISVSDIDGNGEYDFFINGSKQHPGSFYFQKNGRFSQQTLSDKQSAWSEDQGTLLFDADADGDIDLLIISGSNELENNTQPYRDRLYQNDGKGNFTLVEDALPESFEAGTCVKGADIDMDGDIDLFVGGGAIPGSYPFASSSYILRNDSKPGHIRFTDITEKYCPALKESHLIKDALWTDFNNDTNIDLILVGEWMPVRFLLNSGQFLNDVTEDTGIGHLKGWWNSLAGGDFDNDGDIDYLAGNHGLNSFYKASEEEPLTAYASDFDNNGRTDLIMGGYFEDIDEGRKVFPLHFRNDINKQIDLMKKRFPSFKDYSEATLDSIFSKEELKNAMTFSVNFFKSVYIENLGNDRFHMKPLPLEAQFAPVYGFLPGDFNDDQFLDVLLVGNFFGNNPFWGRIDALNGLLLTGLGNGDFQAMDYTKTGFLVEGDARAIVELPLSTGKNLILVTQNQDSLKTFLRKRILNHILTSNNDAWAHLIFKDGTQRKQEFYYGSSYLSQSARVMNLTENVESYKIFKYDGSYREGD